jgi:hypothetical protein
MQHSIRDRAASGEIDSRPSVREGRGCDGEPELGAELVWPVRASVPTRHFTRVCILVPLPPSRSLCVLLSCVVAVHGGSPAVRLLVPLCLEGRKPLGCWVSPSNGPQRTGTGGQQSTHDKDGWQGWEKRAGRRQCG